MKHTLLPLDEFTARRAKFLSQMPEQSIAILSAADEVTRSNDTEYPFCQNKSFYYLCGFNEPEAFLVLLKKNKSTDVLLFSRPKDPLLEVWHGLRVGQENAVSEYGVDQCINIDEIDTQLPELLNGLENLFYPVGESACLDSKITAWLNKVKSTSRQGGIAPKTLVDCAEIIHEMRLIKSESELSIMRKANVISGLAHQRAMEKTQAGKFEYQIEAELLHEFARHGARFPAYNSIVAGGNNANILHYTNNADVLADGDLLLIDAGAELAGYAADITRTFPVSGTFSTEQKTLYQLVLDAQELAISNIKPAQTLAYLNKITCEFFTTGLHALGLLQGNLADLIASKACKKYFIHGLGHWLGLDVHDVGNYHTNDKREQLRAFEQGMVMTIEPGLYIPLDDVDVDLKWRGIGIRIEDNILVTETGFENLTVNAPKTVIEIETLMQGTAHKNNQDNISELKV